MIYTLRAMHSRSIPLSLHHRLSPFLPASSYNNVVARTASSFQASSSSSSSPRPTGSSPALPDSPPKVAHPSSLISDTLRVAPEPPKAPRQQHQAPRIRSRKAALTLTPTAVQRLHALISGPTPQLIRIGVRNKGCAGMQYHLEYVHQPGKFDEVVQQDDVKVLIDSKALFSIIGSEMDWQEDRMSSKFVFKNPNIVDACGCGESFNVAPSSDQK